MTSGGHARSGPAPSPGSGRSDARGLKSKSLPAEGYDGEIPEFPRPIVHGSELAYWNAAWRTPQAALWATPQWSYVIPDVALYCSLMAWTETGDYPVGILANARSLKGDILLTNDALLRAGFQVATDELAARRDEKPADRPLSARDRAKRLRAVGDDK